MASRPKRLTAKRIHHALSAKKSNAASGAAGKWFDKLVKLQARLRAPNGCPWDREQTHATLRTYLIEEAYEVLDALENGEDAKFAEEMGDLLLQIVFHSQIAREQGRFTVADVIREVHEKMVRRHPHVFGEKRAKNAAEVLKNWEQIKQEERRAKGNSVAPARKSVPQESLLDGMPRGLPALMEGFQLTRRAARIGFDWDSPAGIFNKLDEEALELRDALSQGHAEEIEGEIGDLLFVAINLARFLKVDPEIAVKKANAKFSRRFREMETIASERGTTLPAVPRPELELLWEEAKARLAGNKAPLRKGRPA
jgi:tetrapyrrole methylase family protein/MazG family protein